MGKLTTHILDATHGCPANGVTIQLYRLDDRTRLEIVNATTNSDGRTDEPLLENGELHKGVYELEFHIGDYFRKKVELADTPFLDVVPIRFGINDADAHYHVPLLASPFSYSTYRGS